MAWRFYRDMVPFCAMVLVECTSVGVMILFKAATLKGLSYYVYIAYCNAVSTLVLLLPLPFFFYRMEKADLRSTSTRPKVLGSVLSISGAIIVALYKGPTILSDSSSSSQSPSINHSQLNSSSQTNWILGGFLLAAGGFRFSIWYIVQIHIIKLYPVEVIVVFLYNLCGTLILTPVCLLEEANWSSWRLNLDVKLAAILYSGFFSTCISSLVHTWGLHVKGPVYISIFKPLSIAISAAMSVIFLGEALNLGSVIGAVIVSIGFYAVIWGKAKEEDLKEDCYGSSSMRTTSDSQTPFLQSHNLGDNQEILYSDC